MDSGGFVCHSGDVRLLAAAVVALILVPSALADARTDRQIRQLQQQVKALTAQVKVLQQKVIVLSAADARQAARTERVYDYAVCSALLGHDFTRLTWDVLDRIAVRVMGSVAFGPQERVDDRGACERSGTTRTLTMSLLTFGLPR